MRGCHPHPGTCYLHNQESQVFSRGDFRLDPGDRSYPEHVKWVWGRFLRHHQEKQRILCLWRRRFPELTAVSAAAGQGGQPCMGSMSVTGGQRTGQGWWQATELDARLSVPDSRRVQPPKKNRKTGNQMRLTGFATVQVFSVSLTPAPQITAHLSRGGVIFLKAISRGFGCWQYRLLLNGECHPEKWTFRIIHQTCGMYRK
jgi:hypothetical protein